MIIRYKCFETNSSSTHALCIGKGLKFQTPLELITSYKNRGTNNDYEILDHSQEYLPITDKYVRSQIRKNFFNGINNTKKEIEEFKNDTQQLKEEESIKLDIFKIDKMYHNLMRHFNWYEKQKQKDWYDTNDYLDYCDSYCISYMNNHTDTILLRRFENVGRQFKIYETPISKLNFIWTCLCNNITRIIKDDNFNDICKGEELVIKFLKLLEDKGFKIKLMDLNIVTKNINDIGNIKTELKNYIGSYTNYKNEKELICLVGKEVYGYAPMEELYKILNDEVLFYNLVFGNSKIYTGSDEWDTFEDLNFDSYLYRLVGGSDSSNCNYNNIFSYKEPKPLGTYLNGNYETKIYQDGTRVRTLQPKEIFYNNGIFKEDFFKQQEIEIMNPQFPESIDLKITNYCDNNCPFCYANCNKEGKHANIDFIKRVIDEMHPYTEIAIGGGNALEHPNLVDILKYAYSKNIICNITLKDIDIVNKSDLVQNLLHKNLINQIGISPSNIDTLQQAIHIVDNASWDSYILHLVLGVHDKTFLEQIKQAHLHIYRVLFLGYKFKGRGEPYYNKNVKQIKQNIKDIKEMIDNSTLPFYGDVIAFDNLAIRQLELDVQNKYKQLYQGNDGKFSFYVDAVNQTYAKSSLSKYEDNFTQFINLEDILVFLKDEKDMEE